MGTSARELFKAARERAGMTQAQLADRLGVGAAWVSHRETGHCRISLDDAQALANALVMENSEWLTLRFAAPERPDAASEQPDAAA